MDRGGGGVVLDCKYLLEVAESNRTRAARKLQDFLESYDGEEQLDF